MRSRAEFFRSLALGPSLAALLLVSGPTACASSPSATYSQRAPTRGGTGKIYMGREIALTMTWHGIPWLERDERAEREKPDLVVERLELEPDDVVADIGAGSGYFTFRMARRVPEGKVLAVDVQPEMIETLEQRQQELALSNVELVLGAYDDPHLPPSSIDLALMVDAYHEFSYPQEMMAATFTALRPGGRVVLVEYRERDRDSNIHPLHRMSEEQVRREMAVVGLEWQETLDFLPDQNMLVFVKPKPASPADD